MRKETHFVVLVVCAAAWNEELGSTTEMKGFHRGGQGYLGNLVSFLRLLKRL